MLQLADVFHHETDGIAGFDVDPVRLEAHRIVRDHFDGAIGISGIRGLAKGDLVATGSVSVVVAMTALMFSRRNGCSEWCEEQ